MSPRTASELFDLSGKVAVVTGGSRGLGREMVLAFAAHGADVVIASRKVANCESVADEVRASCTLAFPERAPPIFPPVDLPPGVVVKTVTARVLDGSVQRAAQTVELGQ